MIYKDGGYRIRIVKDTGILGTSGNPLKELKAGDWLTYYTHTGGECGVWFAPDVARVAARALGLVDSEYEVVEVGFLDTAVVANWLYNLLHDSGFKSSCIYGSKALGDYTIIKKS